MCYRPSDAKQSGPMKCPLCGKINKPHSTVCARCGATEEDIMAALADQIALGGMDAGASEAAAPASPSAPKPPSIPGPPTIAAPAAPAAPAPSAPAAPEVQI